MELVLSYVTLRGDHMTDPACEQEICRHCHYVDMLDANGLTGTGMDYYALDDAQKA